MSFRKLRGIVLHYLAATVAFFCLSGEVSAGEADVVAVSAQETSKGVWRFDVTITHADDGWSHYADRFDVLDLAGNLLGERILLHPHVTEQPFTRSLDGVVIAPVVLEVEIRAHDKVHGLGGKTLHLALPRAGK